MKKNLLSITCLVFMPLLLWSQDESLVVRNVLAKVLDEEGKVIEIFYTLEDELLEDKDYVVTLYGVFDNSSRKRLFKVEGDVGDSVRVGNNRIVWFAEQEFPRFRGEIYFEVRAIRAFDILRPEPGTVIKRGNYFTFEWFGEGSNNDQLLLELYQNKILVDTLATVDSENHYRWKVPNNNPIGTGFQLKMTGTELTGIEAFSEPFTIKRKIPLAIPIGALSAAVITGVVILFLPDGGTDRQPLPPPIDPDDP
ncbi:MAG: Ser-Thr-rich GPI-anchored membrane family protein [Bacteroidota bacterium]